MHTYKACIHWKRKDDRFTDNRYSRAHTWTFDGGVSVPASSSPASVPLPYSAENAVDPEEALVAAASSCHMLWFLSLAARAGFLIESYNDEAYGVLEKDASGRLSMTRITLRPQTVWGGERTPGPEEIAALHRAAHDECYIANSLKGEVIVEG